MLMNFSVKNYRSFRELNTLSLEPTLSGKSSKLNKLAAIYGPNASGKSNILKALEYFRFAIQNYDAVNKMTTGHPLLQPFLLNEAQLNEPSFFEITLCDKPIKTKYRYGFEVSRKGVVNEWLFETAKRNQKTSERALFLRTNGKVEFDPSVSKDISKFKNNIPETILALPFLANNNYEVARRVADMVIGQFILFESNNIEAINDIAFKRLAEDSKLRSRVMKVVRLLDMGVQGFTIERNQLTEDQLGSDPVLLQLHKLLSQKSKEVVSTAVQTSHNMYNNKGEIVGQQQFSLADHESLGTQKLIPFTTMLLDAMDEGQTLFVDEFGSSFHPFITAALTELFLNSEHDAQMIVFTHEVHLLSQELGLNRDQVWFMEKNRREESSLTSLAEYKPRGDARIDKQYLTGRFGAVPIIFEYKD